MYSLRKKYACLTAFLLCFKTGTLFCSQEFSKVVSPQEKNAVYTTTSLPCNFSIKELAATSDPHVMLIASEKKILFYNIRTGHIEKELHEDHSIEGIAVSADKTKMAVAQGSHVSLWKLYPGTEEKIHSFRFNAGPLQTVTISPDGQYILAGNSWGQVFLWNTTTLKPEVRFNASKNGVYKIALNYAHNLIFTICLPPLLDNDQENVLWSLKEKTVLKELKGHRASGLECALFSTDGRFLVAGGYYGTIILDRETGKISELENIPVYSLASSPDGNTLIAGSFYSGCYLLDVKNGNVLKHLANPDHKYGEAITAVAFNSDGSAIISASARGKLFLHSRSFTPEEQK